MTDEPLRSILIAGVGNAWLRDDGFGGEVARRLTELRLPAEALIRLIYGRLDPAHTPPAEAREVDLDELRQMFPGF